MVADKTGNIASGRKSVTVADASIGTTTIPLIQFSGDTSETAGGSVLEYVTKTAGTGVKICLSNSVAKKVPYLYKRATRTGTGTILKGRDSKVVSSSGVAAGKLVAVVLTADAGEKAGGASVEWIEKNNGVGFTVHLSDTVERDTTFDYYVVTKTDDGEVPTGKDKVEVTDVAFTSATNVIYVSLTSDPGHVAGGAVVEWVDISNGSLATPIDKFTIWLRDKCQHKTTFDYLIL